ncbi:hypothetical protein D3C86_2213110 [compost metagenome]
MIGNSEPYVRSELRRRILEALLQDDRIAAVEKIKITMNGDSALAEFTVVSKYGEFQTKKGIGGNV